LAISTTLRPATVSTPDSSLRTPVLHRLGSRLLTSLGVLSQLGARAVESAWIEPATWVWVTSRNCARPGRRGADLSARGHATRHYDDAVMLIVRLVASRTSRGAELALPSTVTFRAPHAEPRQ
jgi:hypothetical protein